MAVTFFVVRRGVVLTSVAAALCRLSGDTSVAIAALVARVDWLEAELRAQRAATAAAAAARHAAHSTSAAAQGGFVLDDEERGGDSKRGGGKQGGGGDEHVPGGCL